MSSRILQVGVPLIFNQYFEMPFTIEDILAEFEFKLERRTIDLPQSSKPLDLGLLTKALRRNRERIELVNETARRKALISPILFEVAELTNQRINVEYSIAVNEQLKDFDRVSSKPFPQTSPPRRSSPPQPPQTKPPPPTAPTPDYNHPAPTSPSTPPSYLNEKTDRPLLETNRSTPPQQSTNSPGTPTKTPSWSPTE